MEWIIGAALIGLVGTLFSGLGNAAGTIYGTERSIQAGAESQEDAQEFASEDLDKRIAYDREVRESTSPQAMFDKYRNLGVNENAALQAVLGGTIQGSGIGSSSPSIGSVPNFGSAFSQLMPDLMTSFEKFVNADKMHSEKEGQDIKNEYDVTVNPYMVKHAIQTLDLDRKRFDLSVDEFHLAERVAESSIGLQASQIQVNEQNINKLYQDFLNAQQEFYRIKATTRKENAQAELFHEEALTQPVMRENIGSQTKLNDENVKLNQLQQAFQNYLNREEKLTVELSEKYGINLKLPKEGMEYHFMKKSQEKIKSAIKSVRAVNDQIKKRFPLYNGARKLDEFLQSYKNPYEHLRHNYNNWRKNHGGDNAINEFIRENSMFF